MIDRRCPGCGAKDGENHRSQCAYLGKVKPLKVKTVFLVGPEPGSLASFAIKDFPEFVPFFLDSKTAEVAKDKISEAQKTEMVVWPANVVEVRS